MGGACLCLTFLLCCLLPPCVECWQQQDQQQFHPGATWGQGWCCLFLPSARRRVLSVEGAAVLSPHPVPRRAGAEGRSFLFNIMLLHHNVGKLLSPSPGSNTSSRAPMRPHCHKHRKAKPPAEDPCHEKDVWSAFSLLQLRNKIKGVLHT